MKLFDGKKIAQKILKELAVSVSAMIVKPKLAVILVGEDSSSKLYVKLKEKAARQIGIGFEKHIFSGAAREKEIIAKIESLNNDAAVSGIIVQLPLPAVLRSDRIIEAIDPCKDADGFHRENLKLLEKKKERILPVLPAAILTALAAAKKFIQRRDVLALVNSEIFGQALKTVLGRENFSVNYLIRGTCMIAGAEKALKAADILISVCGCPNMIKGDAIKKEAVLIDAGVTRYHDNKVTGDIDRESVKDKAAFLTPVPGGIGPLTVALLLRNVCLAAEKP